MAAHTMKSTADIAVSFCGALGLFALWTSALQGNWLTLAFPASLWVFVLGLTHRRPSLPRAPRKRDKRAAHRHRSARLCARDWRPISALLFGVCAVLIVSRRVSSQRIPDTDVEEAFAQATVLFEEGQLSSALGAFRAIEIPPSLKERRAQKHHNIGVTLLRLNRLDEAAEAFAEAIRDDPDDIIARDLLRAINTRRQ